MASDSPLKLIVESQVPFTPPAKTNISSVKNSIREKGKEEECSIILDDGSSMISDQIQSPAVDKSPVAGEKRPPQDDDMFASPIKPPSGKRKRILMTPDTSPHVIITKESPIKRKSSNLRTKRSPRKFPSPRKILKQDSSIDTLVKRSRSLFSDKQLFGDSLVEDAIFPRVMHVHQREERTAAGHPLNQLNMRPIPISKTDVNGMGMSLGTVTSLKLPMKEIPKELTEHKAETILPEDQTILQRYWILNKELPCHLSHKISFPCSIRIVRKNGTILVNKSCYSTKPKRRRSARLSKRGKENDNDKSEALVDDLPVVGTETTVSSRFGQDTWCQHYHPRHSSHMIGNEAGMREMLDWLKLWKDKCRGTVSLDQSIDENDESYQSDESLHSAMVICGGNGAGKTAAVYACASELGYKVLEINSTQSRTRQSILSILREATLSHQVTASSNSSKTNSGGGKNILSFFKSKGSDQNTTTQTTPNAVSGCGNTVAMTKTTLILLEEVDILFGDEIRGFWPAIHEILSFTKRPLIFTANNPNIAVDFLHRKVVMIPPNQADLALHCRLLASSHDCHMTGQIANQIAQDSLGDIRKLFNTLQFWVAGQTEVVLPPAASTCLSDVLPSLVSSFNQRSVNQEHTHCVYKDLSDCIDACDTVAMMDILTSPGDGSHDLWWNSHMTYSLDDEPIDSDTNCDCVDHHVRCITELCIQKPIPTSMGMNTERSKVIGDIYEKCSEVFHARTRQSRDALVTDCIPALVMLCQHEQTRQDLKLNRRFRHYLHDHNNLNYFHKLITECIYLR